MKSKELQQVLGKFLKSEAAGNARVQVVLPNGEYYDITGMQLLENKTKSLDPCASKLYGGTIKLYKGSRIMELKEKGLKLDACCLGLEACNLYFKSL
jgi:hypothetical protein